MNLDKCLVQDLIPWHPLMKQKSEQPA